VIASTVDAVNFEQFAFDDAVRTTRLVQPQHTCQLLDKLSLVKGKELKTDHIRRSIMIVVYVWMLRRCT
jgi:hypothetical protein